jgi:2-polyprenyl-6-methoxyphenol hydroxylase-like FAD-dependent oxidoreductase
MSLAIRLRAAGWQVDLIESDPQWRVYGAGISITGPTFRACKALGIVEELIDRGYGSHKGVKICAPNGTVVAELPAQPIEPGLPTAGGIMRPVLHDILARRTQACGASIRLGVQADGIDEVPAGAMVRASDGRTGQYNLVVAADVL